MSPSDIDCEGACPRLLIDLDDGTARLVGGRAIDKHPREAECFGRLLNGPRDILLACDIDPGSDTLPTSRSYPFGSGFGCSRIDVKDGNSGTSACKRQGYSLANAMAPSCDKRRLPVEPEGILHD